MAAAQFSQSLCAFFSRKTSLFGARVCTNALTNFCEFAKNCGAKLCFFVKTIEFEACEFRPELGTFEWWILGLMLDPLFFLISRLNNACFPFIINLKINKPTGIKDIIILSFQLWKLLYPMRSREICDVCISKMRDCGPSIVKFVQWISSSAAGVKCFRIQKFQPLMNEYI